MQRSTVRHHGIAGTKVTAETGLADRRFRVARRTKGALTTRIALNAFRRTQSRQVAFLTWT